MYTDGSVLLTHGGTEMGQGLHTKMVQVSSLGTVGSVCGTMLGETEGSDLLEAESGLGSGPGSAAHLNVALSKTSAGLGLGCLHSCEGIGHATSEVTPVTNLVGRCDCV